MTTQYKPQNDSLPGRVLAFFADNPDEELTAQDVADKFGASTKNVHSQLALAIDHHKLVRDRNVDGEYIYKLAGNGTGINIDRAHAPRIPMPQNPFAVKPGKSFGKRVVIDFDALQVDEGVPLASHALRGQNKWKPLFDKLTKPGQSIAIPLDVRTAVGAAATKLNRSKDHSARYRVATIDQNTARVWRIS